jgi:hypothetical protein
MKHRLPVRKEIEFESFWLEKNGFDSTLEIVKLFHLMN